MAKCLPLSPSFGSIHFKLNNGIDMPAIGIGTNRVNTFEETYRLVETSLDIGYRLFDTGSGYGSEAHLGQALKELLPKHELYREDVMISTKISIPNTATTTSTYKEVVNGIKRSLKLLNTDYMDFYMLHISGEAIANSAKQRQQRIIAWKAMEYSCDKGYTDTIGVCDFSSQNISDILYSEDSLVPSVNQVEFNPFCKKTDLLEFCESKFIRMQAYNSLGGASSGRYELLQHPAVAAAARRHNATPAQVLLLWALQQGVAVIPKAVTPTHIEDNFELDFRLSDADMLTLTNISTIE